MRYEGLSGWTLSGGYELSGIDERDPGRINQPVIAPEGYPSTLMGLNQRMPPVTPPEMYPSSLTRGSAGHAPFSVSSLVQQKSSLAGGNLSNQRNLARASLPIIPREGFPSTLLGGLNRRMPPVTPPESYPATLQGLGDLTSDLNFGPAAVIQTILKNLFLVDKARLAALLIGYLTYKKLPIQQAFLASMIAPWAVRPAIGCPSQDPLTKLVDGAESVLAGLLAIGGGGYL